MAWSSPPTCTAGQVRLLLAQQKQDAELPGAEPSDSALSHLLWPRPPKPSTLPSVHHQRPGTRRSSRQDDPRGVPATVRNTADFGPVAWSYNASDLTVPQSASGGEPPPLLPDQILPDRDLDQLLAQILRRADIEKGMEKESPKVCPP